MKPLILALILAVPASARNINDSRVSAAAELESEIVQKRIDVDAAIQRWEADLDQRISNVKTRCLYSPAIVDRTCVDAGTYYIGGNEATPFSYDDQRIFDEAEKYYESAMFFKEMAELEEFAATRLTKWSVWELIFKTAWRDLVVDPEGTTTRYMNTPGMKIKVAEDRAKSKYEDLRSKAAAQAEAGMYTDDQKIALAACVSAVGFSGYNQAEADEVKAGTSKPFSSARLPWQSFVTDYAPQKTGKGVCRDYAAVARDFLRHMGFGNRTRVVGDSGHAMTEVTLTRGGRDKVFLFEPQHNLLKSDCRLYSYPK